MSVSTILAYDAEDNKVDIFTTDDPAEGGGAKLQDIVNALGDESTVGSEADSTNVATLNARLAALTDALQAGQGSDQLRVALAKDLLSSALSVSIDAQSGFVTVTDSGSFTLAANDGTDIGDVGIDDISTVTGQSTKGSSLPVTLASNEDNVPAAIKSLSAVTGKKSKSASLSITVASDEGAIPVDTGQNVSGGSSKASVSDTSFAEIQASNGQTSVTVMASASGGAMTVTVEVSSDGNNWYEDTSLFSSDVSAGDAVAESFTVGAEYVRASGDANVGTVEVAAKGT